MTSWSERALCRGRDNTPWFPERVNDTRIARAKEICRACPVRVDCLEFALEKRMPDGTPFVGIWGGTTDEERGIIRLMLAGRSYRDVYNAMRESS